MMASTAGEYEEYDNGDRDDYDDYEEEYEVEEVVDDAPMRIHERVFLGSIDAARNGEALARANVGITLALLGAGDERVAISSDDHSESDTAPNVTRVLVEMEDSADEPLFTRLPALLATLQETLSYAGKRDCNVLVHCMAGRSRSPSLVAAWLMVIQQSTLQQALGRIESIRPWIGINPRFRRDLELFDHVVRHDPHSHALDATWKALLIAHRTVLPRIDFGAALVPDILADDKTVTMRLLSDVDNDRNSDLKRIFPHATVVATTAGQQDPTNREAFAFLRIDRVDAGFTLAAMDQAIVNKTGSTSKDHVLSVLQSFYPDMTMETPLFVVSFTCMGSISH